ncbi:hypothetical protein AAFF_G00269430 [Aldrovandia affinis]|uniref:Uncharacterized protein n=1 Tax=Aldrovandia affinis TaxID=143900 RepID=A0AAD7SSB2_9TELE|nr:hypothetical protein AAFF_G00269430 [Aldrovandia affinis]
MEDTKLELQNTYSEPGFEDMGHGRSSVDVLSNAEARRLRLGLVRPHSLTSPPDLWDDSRGAVAPFGQTG